jgi:hypothetical protein
MNIYNLPNCTSALPIYFFLSPIVPGHNAKPPSTRDISYLPLHYPSSNVFVNKEL